MRPRVSAFILAAAAMLTVVTGCGTRSILVPVTRHAEINLHAADTALILPSAALGGGELSQLMAVHLDSLLRFMLSDGDQVIILAEAEYDAPRLFTTAGSVSRRSLRWWSARYASGLLLSCEITHSRFSEHVTGAEIHSTRAPGSVKNVRQGRAEATCRVVLVDARREQLLFDDTLHVSTSGETHATDVAPPALETNNFAAALARQVAERITDASHPIRDRDVITFLVDDDYPEIETAITYAEEGRWKMAAEVLRRLTGSLEGRENADIVWYDLGLVLQYSEDFKAALEAFDRAIALRDRSRYRYARAALLGSEDRYLERLKRQQ